MFSPQTVQDNLPYCDLCMFNATLTPFYKECAFKVLTKRKEKKTEYH